MLTIKLFDALVGSRKTRMKDHDLRTWARIEYKNDAEFAYNYMVENGTSPSLGIK
jgi:hypothetical protein